jgi:aspartyl-tRNA(Asn)/glutamyl-tRNA(Gln) amidotransferase subunit A
MSDSTELSAVAIAEAVRSGRLTAEQVAREHLARIKAAEPRVRAFVTVLEDQALAMAKAVDAKRANGAPVGAMAGVPVALKDNIQLKGVETTCSSKILKGHKAAYDATVVERLRAADAVFLGKTNLDEFAMGSSTENSAFFKTANPWNLACVPGGSSGGSAAAVAARFAPVALGSDTGGSIRQPAAFCGVVGMKPTYGAVSRYGLVAFASSLDQIGPFCRSVDDVALVMSVIAGHDPRDTTSAPERIDWSVEGADNIKGLRIGLPKEYFIPGLSPDVEKAVRESVKTLESLGATVREVSLPHTKYAIATYYIIAPCEASSNLARFDGIRYGFSARSAASLEDLYETSRGEGFGPEVKRRIMLGTYALSSGYYDAYYSKAQRVRTLLSRDFEDAFKQVDLIACPTTPTPPFRFGEKTDDPIAMYLSDVFTIPSNMAGNASVSIPCGQTSDKLPLGVQLIGDVHRDQLVLRAARALEKAKPFPMLASVAS